jgi:hypothetical protein
MHADTFRCTSYIGAVNTDTTPWQGTLTPPTGENSHALQRLAVFIDGAERRIDSSQQSARTLRLHPGVRGPSRTFLFEIMRQGQGHQQHGAGVMTLRNRQLLQSAIDDPGRPLQDVVRRGGGHSIGVPPNLQLDGPFAHGAVVARLGRRQKAVLTPQLRRLPVKTRASSQAR